MTITLELPPELEGRFVAEAKAKGVPVGKVVKAYLLSQCAALSEAVQMSPKEWDKAWV